MLASGRRAALVRSTTRLFRQSGWGEQPGSYSVVTAVPLMLTISMPLFCPSTS
jgi:hypothetical protein